MRLSGSSALPRIGFAILLATLTIRTGIAKAQAPCGIQGVLTDPMGAALADATISAQRIHRSSKPAVTQSGPDGKFTLQLSPGDYRVTVKRASFSPVQKEFTLEPGQTAAWNLRMELATNSANVVVTAAAEPTLASSSVLPVRVITRSEIENRQELWLAPVLSTSAGVSLAQEGAYGGISTIFLDGGNSNFTKVLIDGAPANQPGGDIDLEGLDVEDVDKIEIVHGAASALYGSDAMTGVVQIFTHRGTTTTPELTLQSDGGTFGTGRGGGELSGVLGRLDYSGSASYFSTSGQGANDYFRNDAQSGNFGWKFNDTDQLRLSMRNDVNDAGTPGSIYAPTPESHLGQHDFFASASWDASVSQHWSNHLEGTDAFVRQSIFNPAYDVFDRFYRSGLDEQLSYAVPHGVATVGYEYEVENGEPGGPPHERRNNMAGYFEGRYQLGARLTAMAGGRVEDNASFGTAAVPRVGLAYVARVGRGFWGTTRLRASYGLGIKEPTFVQSFEDDPCYPGNPDLRPERSTTVDAGVEQMLDSGRVKFSMTYFHNDFHDMVSFSEDFNPSPGCPYGTGTFFNTDKARAFGADSSFEAALSSWLSVAGNYTFDDTRVLVAPNAVFIDPTLEPGNRLLHRPLHSAILVFNARIRRMNWNLAGTYVGRAQDSDFLGLGITSNPSWVRWDLAAGIPLHHGLSATARLENLFDRHYQYAVGYPALGFNYRLGVKYVWGGAQ
jgi:outer membrane cobalamin receptor